jgi:hypothetical protein
MSCATISQFVITTALIAFINGCSTVVVKTPTELVAGKGSNHSFVLIRLAAEIENKLVDTSLSIIEGGLSYPYTVTIAKVTAGEVPVTIYPNTNYSAAPSEQSKSQGWIYFPVAPSDYYLEVASWRVDAYRAYKLAKQYQLHVEDNPKVIYAGSFFTKCRTSEALFVDTCDETSIPVNESDAAEVIAKSSLSNLGPFVVEILQPYQKKLIGGISNMLPIGVIIQSSDKLGSVPWITRGMSRFTGIGNPGRETSKSQQGTTNSEFNWLSLLPGEAYALYLPIGMALGATYGKYTKEKWQPCFDALQKEITVFNFRSKLKDAIDKEFSSKNNGLPILLNESESYMDEAARLGLKSILIANVQRVQLRECLINGTFCIEVVLSFSLRDVKTGQVLYKKSFIYTQSEADNQERPYEIYTKGHPDCFNLASYCHQDRKVFFDQLIRALNIEAVEMVDSLNGK